jgi:hypothetical protein
MFFKEPKAEICGEMLTKEEAIEFYEDDEGINGQIWRSKSKEDQEKLLEEKFGTPPFEKGTTSRAVALALSYTLFFLFLGSVSALLLEEGKRQRFIASQQGTQNTEIKYPKLPERTNSQLAIFDEEAAELEFRTKHYIAQTIQRIKETEKTIETYNQLPYKYAAKKVKSEEYELLRQKRREFTKKLNTIYHKRN